MEFRYTEGEINFRKEIRAALVEDMKAVRSNDDGDVEEGGWSSEFSRKLGARGLISLPWPVAYGGSGLGHMKQMIFNEEVGDLRAPIGAHRRGLFYAAPILMLYGTEEQKSRLLPQIAAGDAYFCQGFSEPGAGSDLASLRTTAVRDGDHYVVNGSKIWTSDAHRADFMFLVARSDSSAPKHLGLSNFIVDMRLPGITVRPLVNMAGAHSFNEVFFDNLMLPVTMLVGQENRGWYQTAVALDYERSSISSFSGVARTMRDYAAVSRQARVDLNVSLRLEFADAVTAIEVGRLMGYRIVSMQSKGEIPNREAAMAKLFASELSQRVAGIGIRLFGMRSNLLAGAEVDALAQRAARSYLQAVSSTIGGGTSEIQRNVIAQRGVGLPRG